MRSRIILGNANLSTAGGLVSALLGKAFAQAVLTIESTDVNVIVAAEKKNAQEIIKDLDSFNTWRPHKEGSACARCKKAFAWYRLKHL
jgi:hypothetical protein